MNIEWFINELRLEQFNFLKCRININNDSSIIDYETLSNTNEIYLFIYFYTIKWDVSKFIVNRNS